MSALERLVQEVGAWILLVVCTAVTEGAVFLLTGVVRL